MAEFNLAAWNAENNMKGEFNPEQIKAMAKAQAGGSKLAQMALVLGMVADNMMDNVMDLALDLGKIQEKNSKLENAGGVADKESENQASALMQAQTQIMNMFMQALSNMIKTVGEGGATVARKG